MNILPLTRLTDNIPIIVEWDIPEWVLENKGWLYLFFRGTIYHIC